MTSLCSLNRSRYYGPTTSLTTPSACWHAATRMILYPTDCSGPGQLLLQSGPD
jgi:hypothetical protein